MSRSVVKEWVSDLTFCQQAVLLAALRGCDVSPKVHPTKDLVAALRYVVMHSAFESMTMPEEGSTAFMRPDPPEKLPHLDEMPFHWVGHIMHAVEIVGYKHPDPDTRLAWRLLYVQFCKKLHLQPETEAKLDERLKGELG